MESPSGTFYGEKSISVSLTVMQGFDWDSMAAGEPCIAFIDFVLLQ